MAGRLTDDQQLLENTAYAVLYSTTRRNPILSAYYLGPVPSNAVACPRSSWRVDRRVADPVSSGEYTNTGLDRSHMAPSAHIGIRYGCEAQAETFLFSNVAPQAPQVNQGPWKSVEEAASARYANQFGGVWVATGPIYSPDYRQTLCGSTVEVPIEFWKLIIRVTDEGHPDVLAVVMPQEGLAGPTLQAIATTVDDVEERTGLDFFADLDPALEADIESRCPSSVWNTQLPLSQSKGGNIRPRCIDSEVRTEPLARPNTRAGHAPVCR